MFTKFGDIYIYIYIFSGTIYVYIIYNISPNFVNIVGIPTTYAAN